MRQRGLGTPTLGACAAIAALAIAAAIAATVLRVTSEAGGEEPGLQAALLDWVILSYVFSGLVVLRRRPDSRLGPLMIAGGFGVALSGPSVATDAAAFTFGQAFDLLPFAIFIHVYLAFPTGRLPGAVDRAVVIASYVVAVGGELLVLILGGLRPDNVIAVVAEPDAAQSLFDGVLIALAVLALVSIVVLVVRRVRGGAPLRRSTALLVDSFLLALLMIAALLTMGATSVASDLFLPVQRATFIVLGLAPVAFMIALLDARLARSSVGELLVELRSDAATGDLRGPLSRALKDPSLEIAYWLPKFGTWADADGRPVRLDELGPERATTVIDREGEHVAALVHDASLTEEPELLQAASAAAEIALENGQLHAELRARLEELDESRGRVIEAEQEERKRLERNLHDGAQQRLIALSLELGLLGSKLEDDPEAQERIDAARDEIAVSLSELRDVARGLHPAVLSGHGLAVALESLAATSPVPVRLRVDVDGRLAEPVEVAAYYVVAESLANVAKHAEADLVTVDVARADSELVVEVVDDGVGGADTERGSGIRGLADRVEAQGGQLRVWTPRGGGTRVRADLPCG